MNRHGTGVDRGQTLQDFVIGISVFLLAVAAAFAAFWSLPGVFAAGVSTEDVSTADRIGETVVRNLSTDRSANELDADLLEDTLDRDTPELRSRWGLRNATSFNLTVRTLNGSTIRKRGGTQLAAGSQHTGETAATDAHVVTLTDGCEPACRFVVRVW